MTNHNDTWGDVNAQLDYFTNAGLSIDSIYNSALTTDKLLSISPIKSTTSNKDTTTTWYLATEDQLDYPRDCEEDLLCSDFVSLHPLPSTPTKKSSLVIVDKQPQGMKVCIDKAALLAKRRSKLQEDDMKVCIDKVALFSNRRPQRSKAKHHISALQRQALKYYKKKNKAKHTTAKKSSGKGIKSPTAKDILRGRGQTINKHEGNMKLRDEARKLRDDYQDGNYGSSEKKYLYSLELVERVRSYGGRFLEKRGNDNLWYEMNEEDTRKKAAQGEISCYRCVDRLSYLTDTYYLFLFDLSFQYFERRDGNSQ